VLPEPRSSFHENAVKPGCLGESISQVVVVTAGKAEGEKARSGDGTASTVASAASLAPSVLTPETLGAKGSLMTAAAAGALGLYLSPLPLASPMALAV